MPKGTLVPNKTKACARSRFRISATCLFLGSFQLRHHFFDVCRRIRQRWIDQLMSVRCDEAHVLFVETLSIDIEIGSERHGITDVQLLWWVYLHHIETVGVHDPPRRF